MNNFSKIEEAYPSVMLESPYWAVFVEYVNQGSTAPKLCPLDPKTGKPAKSNDHSTLSDFYTARDYALAHNIPHIAYLTNKDSGIVCLDLDDKEDNPASDEQKALHYRLVEALDSLTEKSRSRRGYHVWVRSTFPVSQLKSNKVEVYADGHFIIVTGSVIDQFSTQIEERSEFMNRLYAEMKSASATVSSAPPYEDQPETRSDNEVIQSATNAENGEKFNFLMSVSEEEVKTGDDYESPSEAEKALLGILCFYSKSNAQVTRIYYRSNLAKREKVRKRPDYVTHTIDKLRREQPAPVDLSNLRSMPSPPVQTAPPPEEEQPQLTFPPGLMGEIAQYIYSSAIRPVPEVALAAAISLVAGIVGRAFNISNTGLNTYVVLLAGTGVGKEGADKGINTLFKATSLKCPLIRNYHGPSVFASGQALLKRLTKQQCFVSILGEFGLTLQKMCDPRASQHDLMLQKVLLDLYNKSDINTLLAPMVYADTEKDTDFIFAPCVTLLGETTPETFFEKLNTSNVGSGLIPRLLTIQYKGKRPPKNPNAFAPPHDSLTTNLATLATVCLTANEANVATPVEIAPDAQQFIDEYSSEVDDIINNNLEADEIVQIYNRAELKVLKLAASVAVGVNWYAPVVTLDIAKWAKDLVQRDISNMLDNFDNGVLGGLEAEQHTYMKKRFLEYPKIDKKKRNTSYNVPEAIVQYDIITYSYLYRRLKNLKCFTDSRYGVERAIDDTLKVMKKCGEIEEIPKVQMAEMGIHVPCYSVKSLA